MQSLLTFRKPPSHRTLGIEWECFFKAEECPEYDQYKGFFYVTTDGSLRWGNVACGFHCGRELVSQPLTSPWLVKELERLAKKLPPMYYNETCGIHIHVSRKWATAKKVDHLITFFKTLTDLECYDAFGRIPNDYCYHMKSDQATKGNRYNAINLTNDATVEFRVFRSGNVKWAQYCVKLVEYMLTNAFHLNKDAFFAFVDMEKPE